ncbi:MAG: DUF1638 domain-containing protein [Spirochaetes bacterium]|nr:DUF1638 domain-containing protein [Spirochaetota bacterium]
MRDVTFKNTAILSCGTLRPELSRLREEGFLDADTVLYTTPGLHEDWRELERQLIRTVQKAKEKAPGVLVVYGGKFCYINGNEPTRTMKTIIAEMGPGVSRINATHCMDMLASGSERDAIAGGEKVLWLTPGWIQFRHFVYKDRDKGFAVENFPRHTGGAMVLDGIGFMDAYMEEHVEELLEYSDWMGIPILPAQVTLDRFKSLLAEQADILKLQR